MIICPYCGKNAKLVKGDIVYPHRQDLYYKNFWLCAPCDAYVGTHDKSAKYKHSGIEPLCRLANKTLRKLKSEAHLAFDVLWKSGSSFDSFGGPFTRTNAYRWLAKQMNISIDACHIGYFDEPPM